MAYWLHSDWKPWALKQGIALMGEDIRHIERCLSRIPVEKHRKAVKRYVDVWLATSGDPINQNKGRFAANQYILNL